MEESRLEHIPDFMMENSLPNAPVNGFQDGHGQGSFPNLHPGLQVAAPDGTQPNPAHAANSGKSSHESRSLGDANSSQGNAASPADADERRGPFTKAQVTQLEGQFLVQLYLDHEGRRELAMKAGLTETQVKTWFQNRRSRFKKHGNRDPTYTESRMYQLQNRSAYPFLNTATNAPGSTQPASNGLVNSDATSFLAGMRNGGGGLVDMNTTSATFRNCARNGGGGFGMTTQSGSGFIRPSSNAYGGISTGSQSPNNLAQYPSLMHQNYMQCQNASWNYQQQNLDASLANTVQPDSLPSNGHHPNRQASVHKAIGQQPTRHHPYNYPPNRNQPNLQLLSQSHQDNHHQDRSADPDNSWITLPPCRKMIPLPASSRTESTNGRALSGDQNGSLAQSPSAMPPAYSASNRHGLLNVSVLDQSWDWDVREICGDENGTGNTQQHQ